MRWGKTSDSQIPYYQIIQPVEPPSSPTLQPYGEESPMSVGGVRMSATLDGMAVPMSIALSALNNGSAIPASIAWAQGLTGFRFDSVGLGLFTLHIPGHYVNVPNGADDEDTVRIGSWDYVPARTETVYLGDNKWIIAIFPLIQSLSWRRHLSD